MSEKKYPECEKLASVSNESQKIGEFLSYLGEKGIVLAEWHEAFGELIQCSTNLEIILAEYFDIDMAKVEKERRAILDNLRAQDD